MKTESLLILVMLSLLLAACGGGGASVGVGTKAPSVVTKTLADVGGDLSKITTYRYPDKRMYQYSLDKALATGKPIVLEFATPGHCTVCDKQLQVVKGVMEKYQSQVLFLHMDQYQNPEAYTAFHVIGDPWTYVIDRQQIVRYRLAGRVLYGELDAVIKRVLNEKIEKKS